MFAMNAEAEIDVKAAGQADAVELAELTVVVVLLEVVVGGIEVVEDELVEDLDELVTTVVDAVPGMHCE